MANRIEMNDSQEMGMQIESIESIWIAFKIVFFPEALYLDNHKM